MTTRRISTTTEPVTTADVKTMLPLTGTDFDTRIGLLIPALRLQAEQITNRSLALSTWQIKLDSFPAEIRLLWPPVVSITSITYVDTAGATQTLSSSAYVIDSHSEPGWVIPATDTEWPDTYDTANAVTVNYTAGYGSSAPEVVKLWIAAMIRADIDGAEPGSIDGLLDSLKVYA